MTTGKNERMIMLGRITTIDGMPTADLAGPYAAMRFANTTAAATPMKPKKTEERSTLLILYTPGQVNQDMRAWLIEPHDWCLQLRCPRTEW